MADLQVCYFCGTGPDGSLGEYAVVPPALEPTDDQQQSVVLCGDCRAKLTTVMEPVVDAAEAYATGAAGGSDAGTTAPDQSATDAGTEEPPGGTDDGPGASADAPGTVSAEGGGADDEAADADEGPTEPAAADEGATGDTPSDVDGGADGESDHGGAGNAESSDAEPTGAEASGAEPSGGERSDDGASADGTEPDNAPGPAEGPGTGEGPPADSQAPRDQPHTDDELVGRNNEAYNKTLRLLQNREFPVERHEIEQVAANAYQLDPQEVSDAIDALISKGLLTQEGAQLVRP